MSRSRPTVLTMGLVVGATLLAALCAAWRLDVVLATGAGLLAGVATGIGLRTSARTGPIARFVSAGSLAIAGLCLSTAVALGAVGAYQSFGTLAVLPSALLARLVPYTMAVVGAVAAGVGLVTLGSGRRLVDGATTAAWTAGIVCLTAVTITGWLLRGFLAFNLNHFGIDPAPTAALVVFARGASGPQLGSLVALVGIVIAATVVGASRVPASADLPGEWELDTQRVRRGALVVGVAALCLSVPLAVADLLGLWGKLLPGVLTGALTLVTTAAAVRLLLLVLALAGLAAYGLYWVTEATWRRLLEPGAALLGSLPGPLVLVVLFERTPIIEWSIEVSPPDAAQSIELLVEELGGLELLFLAGSGGAVALALGVLLGTLLAVLDGLPERSIGPVLAGGGATVLGTAVVVHAGPAVTGFLAVGLGLLAWWVGAFGHGIADAAAPEGPTTVEAVHATGSAGAIALGLLVAACVGVLAGRAGTAGMDGIGLSTLAALVGLLVLALVVRDRRLSSDS